jgi:hypothetical protein
MADKKQHKRAGKALKPERAEVVVEHPHGKEKRVSEIRGLRSNLSRTFFKPSGGIDLQRTLAHFVLERFTPTDQYLTLLQSAEALLAAKGEATARGKSEEATKIAAGESSEVAADLRFVLLAVWRSQIAGKYGTVSAEALSSSFLYSAEIVYEKLGHDSKLLEEVFSFAQAWHEWQSEVLGEHEAAAKSVASSANLRKAAPKRRESKAERSAVVRAAMDRHWVTKPNHHGLKNATATSILEEVNRNLVAAGHKPYTKDSLIKLVGSIVSIQGRQS